VAVPARRDLDDFHISGPLIIGSRPAGGFVLAERVLAVPTAAIDRLGAFQGFSADRRYFAALAESRFLERAAAEEDESHRQIIPYVVLRAGRRLFSYARTNRGGERRLHGLRSVGVGGHVNPDDLPEGLAGLVAAPEPTLVAAARRELAEETSLAAGAELGWLGFLRDDQAPVARVHFGVVFAAELPDESAALSDEGKMADARFLSVDDLLRDRDDYEGWSRIVIERLAAR
jgi:predicted NUDIX family phosphoesterase